MRKSLLLHDSSDMSIEYNAFIFPTLFSFKKLIRFFTNVVKSFSTSPKARTAFPKSLSTLLTYLLTRRPVPSTDQAIPSCFYFRISWILMEQRCFYFFLFPRFLEGLRSLKHWLLQKVSMKDLDQKFKFLIEK